MPPPCSKSLIGDYLGERDDFNLKVMHSYVDALDFTEMEFDEAIRLGQHGQAGCSAILRSWGKAARRARPARSMPLGH